MKITKLQKRQVKDWLKFAKKEILKYQAKQEKTKDLEEKLIFEGIIFANIRMFQGMKLVIKALDLEKEFEKYLKS